MNDTADTQHTECQRCHRPLRTAKSRAAGYGPVCARIRRAEAHGYSPQQIADARELIELGGIIRLRDLIFLVVSTDGLDIHRTDARGYCTCKAALKSRRCYHTAAARLLLAA